MLDAVERTDHVILTRFNLPTGGVEGLIRAQDGWLRDRFELFEKYCAPSVAAQEGPPPKWIVYLDPASPAWLLDRMDEHAAGGLLHPVLREVVDATHVREDLARVVPNPGTTLITTNLDNDDGLAIDFCARLAAVETESPRAAVYVTNGLVHSARGLFRLRDRHNAFCSVRETWDHPATCWSEYHNQLHTVMPVVELGGAPGWLQVVHGTNVSNRVRGRLVSPDRYRASFAVPLDVPEPDRKQLVLDRVASGPLRSTRDRSRAFARTLALRAMSKEQYAQVKARLRAARRGRE